jgi:hypothetical protein
MTATVAPPATRLELVDSTFEVNEYFHAQGWTDGLPVMPPTEDKVAEMAAGCDLAPYTILGIMAPANGTVTVEKLAANAVMAGCLPEYFPVVLTGMRAVLEPKFNIGGLATTTGGGAPGFIVSGRLADDLGISGGTGCFGPGYRANAAIGRALRLAIRNLGGAHPGDMDKSTQTWPGKYAFCFAENAARNPFAPLRVALGYRQDVSTLTALGLRGVHYINETAQETGRGNLETIAGSMRRMGIVNYMHQGNGSFIAIVLGPEHAKEIADDGYSRQDIQDYLFEHARMPMRDLRDRTYWNFRSWPEEYDIDDPEFMVPIVMAPDKFIVLVAGGDGRQSAWLSSWYQTEAVTLEISAR